MTLCVTHGMKKIKIINQTDRSLTGIDAKLRGAAASSVWPWTSVNRKEERISAWYLDECWFWTKGEMNTKMYKIIQLHQPAESVYDTCRLL